VFVSLGRLRISLPSCSCSSLEISGALVSRLRTLGLYPFRRPAMFREYIRRIRVYLSMLWFYFVRVVIGNWRVIPHRRYTKHNQSEPKKVLIIGDDFAEGYGDYVQCMTIPGIAEKLASFCESEPRLHQTWHIINGGIAQTTSDDWLPHARALSFKRLWRRMAGQNCWQAIVENQRYDDAQIVVLAVGSKDAK
jgi:hypothetical protein